MPDFPEDMTKRWYVIQTSTGKEDSVKTLLQKSIKDAGMSEKFGEIVVPTEEVVEMRRGQKRQSERKFFPGYVWIEMVMDAQTWHFVKSIRGVTGFLGGREPTALSLDEVNITLRRVQEGVKKPRPKVLFEAGELVRIIAGPFTDFSGVVEGVDYDKNRLRVSVLIFGRATPVELEFSQVQKS